MWCHFVACCAHRHLEYFSIDTDSHENTHQLGLGGFSSFPEVLCQLTNLQSISMTHQLLVRLPASLSNLKKLTVLDL